MMETLVHQRFPLYFFNRKRLRRHLHAFSKSHKVAFKSALENGLLQQRTARELHFDAGLGMGD